MTTAGQPVQAPEKASRQAQESLMLAFGSLVLGMFTQPPAQREVLYVLIPLSSVLALAAIWRGVTALRTSRGAVSPRGALPAIVLAALVLALALWRASAFFLVPEFAEYNDCLLRAKTTSAQASCEELINR